MSDVPFHYVDLRTFCYATEDERRVEDTLRTYLPEDYPIERVENVGHHGDRIVTLSARVENADDVRYVLSQLVRSDTSALEQVRDDLEQRVTDNCELYLYLDKQAALAGAVDLGTGLTFRAKVEAYPAKKSAAVKNVDEAFEDLMEEHEG